MHPSNVMCERWPEQCLSDNRLLFLYSLLHLRHKLVILVVYLI